MHNCFIRTLEDFERSDETLRYRLQFYGFADELLAILRANREKTELSNSVL